MNAKSTDILGNMTTKQTHKHVFRIGTKAIVVKNKNKNTIQINIAFFKISFHFYVFSPSTFS